MKKIDLILNKNEILNSKEQDAVHGGIKSVDLPSGLTGEMDDNWFICECIIDINLDCNFLC